jgi:hypothetical protein
MSSEDPAAPRGHPARGSLEGQTTAHARDSEPTEAPPAPPPVPPHIVAAIAAAAALRPPESDRVSSGARAIPTNLAVDGDPRSPRVRLRSLERAPPRTSDAKGADDPGAAPLFASSASASTEPIGAGAGGAGVSDIKMRAPPHHAVAQETQAAALGLTAAGAPGAGGAQPAVSSAVHTLDAVETLEAGRVRSALEHRRLVYKELASFEQLLLYHRQWLEQPILTRTLQATPDPTTLDARGDDLPLDQLHALAVQSQVKEVADRAAAAVKGDRALLHVDRYVYWYDTKAPPEEWRDVLPDLLALHDARAGFLLVELGLAPPSSAPSAGQQPAGAGFTWFTGLVEEKWVHYAKYALDATLGCSTFVLDPRPWLRSDTKDAKAAPAAEAVERLILVRGGVRYSRRFPSEGAALALRRFLEPINPKLLEHLAATCCFLTVVDHLPGRRDWALKLLARILRNRHKPNDPQSKSKGLNFYVPAIQGLRKERDERQRLRFVEGIHRQLPHLDVKALLEMPLNELRVKFWTLTHQAAPATAAPPRG